MCTYVCMCICAMGVCTYMCAHKSVCMYIHGCVCMVCMHINMRISNYMYVCMSLVFFYGKQATQANLCLKYFIKVLKQESVGSLF